MRIETDVWETVPEKDGAVRYVGQRKTTEVFKDLEIYLKESNIYPYDYFLLSSEFENRFKAFPKLVDMVCYAQWGCNEGIYLEVEVIIDNEETGKRENVHFATGKTLEETGDAYDRMQYIAGSIYKAFMGEHQTPSRYIIVNNGKGKKITYEGLMRKLSCECKEMIKHSLMHEDKPLAEVAGKLGMTLQILDTLREPQVFADLPIDKLKELYETENIMEKLYGLVKHIRKADTWEIGDIIASKPTLLAEPDEKTQEEKISDDAYFGFTHFSRMEYGDLKMPTEFIDEITFGLYVRNDGCISEATIRWEYLSGKPVYHIGIYDDGLKAAFSQKFLAVAAQLKNDGYLSPEEICRILIAEGFEDNSSKPLKEMK